MKLLQPGAAVLAILLLAACGGGDSTPGQPSAEERRELDNIAAKQDAEGAETFDTSPDSLVPAEGGAPVGTNAATPANSAASNTIEANSSANNSSAANAAAPR
jgi:hypothetical protein